MTISVQAYQPNGRRARLATICFWLSMLAAILTIAISVWEIQLWNRVETGAEISLSIAEFVDGLSGVIAVSSVAVFVLTALAFLMWFYRARANLPALGIGDARWSPGWAVGWWFVPIMSLFRPYQTASEIWRASDPQASSADWRTRPVSPLLGWWWGLFVVVNILGQISGRLWLRADETTSAASMQNLLMLDVVAAVADIVGSWLAIRVVAEIERRQTERRQLLAFA